MRRVLVLLRWETSLQRRYMFYGVTALVAAIWVVLLRLLPAEARASPAALVPAFVLTNLQITAFYFGAALVLLERGQGVLAALLVSPLNADEYLWVKALSLTALALVENAAIVWLVFGTDLRWEWFAAGTAALAILYVFAAVSAVAPHAGITTFMIPSIGWVTIFTAPLLGYYDIVPWWAFAWHPMMPPLRLLEAASRDVRPAFLVYAVLGSLVWCVVAQVWARRRLTHVLAPRSV